MRMTASPRSPSLQGPSTLPRYSSRCFHKAICHFVWHPGQESLVPAAHTGRLKLREVDDLPTVTQQLPGSPQLLAGADQLGSVGSSL